MNQDIEYYQAGEAAELINLTSADVAKLGQIITPDVPADGKGYRSLYSFRNLVEMRLGEELSRIGISWKRINKYIEELRKSYCRWLDEYGRDGWLVLDGTWKWGAGDTLEMAMYSIFKGSVASMIIAVNIKVIKDGIRFVKYGNGDSISDLEFNEVKQRVESEGEKLKEKKNAN